MSKGFMKKRLPVVDEPITDEQRERWAREFGELIQQIEGKLKEKPDTPPSPKAYLSK